MKSTFLLFFILVSILGFTQSVDHFSNVQTKWFVAAKYPHGNLQNPSFIETKTRVYGFQGDSIISGEVWLKLFSASDSLFTLNKQFHGWIHAANNKVRHMHINNQIDTLYDFNLNVGDTVLFNFDANPEYIPIVNVDSVQINGLYFKRLTFAESEMINSFTYLKEVWIEGIGSLHGPLFPSEPKLFAEETPDSLFLTCSHTDGQLYYDRPSSAYCFVNIILGIDKSNLIHFEVSPNPFIDKISIKIEMETALSLHIYNALGQKVKSKTLTAKQSIIEVSELPAGVYFLTLDNGQQLISRKMLKK